MRKDRFYNVTICLSFDLFDITGAECGCPVGKGPNATCKHIGGLCYAYKEFSCIKKNIHLLINFNNGISHGQGNYLVYLLHN